MGKIIKSSFKKIITKVLQVLGISSLITSFSSCSPEYPVMYGVPGNFFTLEGTVTDEDGNAIKGIELSAKAKADVPGNEEDNGEQKQFYGDGGKDPGAGHRHARTGAGNAPPERGYPLDGPYRRHGRSAPGHRSAGLRQHQAHRRL